MFILWDVRRKLVDFPIIEDIHGKKYFVDEIVYEKGFIIYLWGNYISKKGKIINTLIFPSEIKKVMKDIFNVILMKGDKKNVRK